jgi:hypothetical protein
VPNTIYIANPDANVDALNVAIATLRDDRWNAQHRWIYRPEREAAIETLSKLRETLAEEQRRRTFNRAQQIANAHRATMGYPPTGHMTTTSVRDNGYDYYASCDCGWVQDS